VVGFNVCRIIVLPPIGLQTTGKHALVFVVVFAFFSLLHGLFIKSTDDYLQTAAANLGK
jgi:hypothetical protein